MIENVTSLGRARKNSAQVSLNNFLVHCLEFDGLDGHKDSVNVYQNGKDEHLGFRMVSEHLEGHWGF